MSMTEIFKLKKYRTTIYEHTCSDCGEVIDFKAGSRQGYKKDGKNICSFCYKGRRVKQPIDPEDYEGTPV
tara:strand:+ start:778 stop:987 length:210 start_codon:yes stop_codon:yes gene_type:complete